MPSATIILCAQSDSLEPLGHALWSIGRQTVQDHEIVIVAGKRSPEDTRKLLALCDTDPRRRLAGDIPVPSTGGQGASGPIFELKDSELCLPWHLESLIAGLKIWRNVRSIPLQAGRGGALNLCAPKGRSEASVFTLPRVLALSFEPGPHLPETMKEWRNRMEEPDFEKNFARWIMELAGRSRGDLSGSPGTACIRDRQAWSLIPARKTPLPESTGKPVATVVIPTTGDRAVLVEQALWSLQQQTLPNFEVFIIGDGVTDASGEKFRQWSRADSRIRFFDHPKHPRRGEEYRHEALREARGEVVCYLCDRDLYLPWHLEAMWGVLADADFAHSLPVTVTEKDDMEIWLRGRVEIPACRRRMVNRNEVQWGVPLSMVAHRLDAYRALPEGWNTTPKERNTDLFMWAKFLGEENIRARSVPTPTVVYLPRGSHPGWPVADRLREMLRWRVKMEAPDFEQAYRNQCAETMLGSWLQWAEHPVRTWSSVALSSARRRAVARHGKESVQARLWRHAEAVAARMMPAAATRSRA